MKTSHCVIIAGHSGSGKTEIADSLAVRFAREGRAAAIADLDIVNPYFRTRECEAELEKYGVEVISSSISGSPYEDTPALSPGIASCFFRTDRVNIIDLGGDPEGAVVLGRYAGCIRDGYDFWVVINANRYRTRTACEALSCLRSIESACGLAATGIINNTHACSESGVRDVLRGETVTGELSAMTGLPVVLTCFEEALSREMEGVATPGEKMPLRLLHRPRWMRSAT